MAPTSIRLDDDTKELLATYCKDTGLRPGVALRHIVRDGLEQYQHNKEIGFTTTIGKSGLMVNQQHAIRAAFETLSLVRSLVDDPSVLKNAVNTTKEVVEKGWHYSHE